MSVAVGADVECHGLGTGRSLHSRTVARSKDALKGLLGLQAIADRLDRVEATVRELALVKDLHQGLLDRVVSVDEPHLAALDAQRRLTQTDDLARRYLATAPAIDPGRLTVVVVRTGDEDALGATQTSVRRLLGPDRDTVVDTLEALEGVPACEFVTIVRAGDRVATGWLDIAVDVLDRSPGAVAVHGERIDVVDERGYALVSRYEPDPHLDELLVTPCIDLGSLVIRRDVLHPAAAGTGSLAPWDVALRVLAAGPVVAVPTTATVGPAGPASTPDELARFREVWPRPVDTVDAS